MKPVILVFDKYSLDSTGKVAIRADKILLMEDFGCKVRIDYAAEQTGIRSVYVTGNWDLIYSKWHSAMPDR